MRLPLSDFDRAGPGVRHHATRATNDGPARILSNPVSALIDAIRGFCTPVDSTQDADSGQFDTAAGTDTLGGGSIDLGGGGGGYPPFGYGGGYGMGGSNCGSGTMFDPQSGSCVPSSDSGGTGDADTGPCSQAELDNAIRALNTAQANGDKQGALAVAAQAGNCAAVSMRGVGRRTAWQGLKLRAQRIAAGIREPRQQGQRMPMRRNSPRMPSHLSTTEGTPRMRPARDPYEGHFDPSPFGRLW